MAAGPAVAQREEPAPPPRSAGRDDPGRGIDLGPSLRAIVADRRPSARSRVVTLVVLTLDDGLVNALVRLRATGLPVSVVHVVDEPATDTRSADGLQRTLTAAGRHYVPLGRADDLHMVLSAGTVGRHALVR